VNLPFVDEDAKEEGGREIYGCAYAYKAQAVYTCSVLSKYVGVKKRIEDNILLPCSTIGTRLEE
jgi:hypothetical protein